MKGNYPLSTPKLTRVLLELLKHPEVKLYFKNMRAQAGHSDWDDICPPTKIIILVDANQQTGVLDHVATTVHELLHVVFAPMCLGWMTDELEEVVILALDAHVNAYIRKSPKRLHEWEEAISAKLMQTDKETEATS